MKLRVPATPHSSVHTSTPSSHGVWQLRQWARLLMVTQYSMQRPMPHRGRAACRSTKCENVSRPPSHWRRVSHDDFLPLPTRSATGRKARSEFQGGVSTACPPAAGPCRREVVMPRPSWPVASQMRSLPMLGPISGSLVRRGGAMAGPDPDGWKAPPARADIPARGEHAVENAESTAASSCVILARGANQHLPRFARLDVEGHRVLAHRMGAFQIAQLHNLMMHKAGMTAGDGQMPLAFAHRQTGRQLRRPRPGALTVQPAAMVEPSSSMTPPSARKARTAMPRRTSAPWRLACSSKNCAAQGG